MTDEDDFDEELIKLLGHFHLKIIAIHNPLRKYGQCDYVDMAIAETMLLSYQLLYMAQGIDMPFELSPHMRHMLEIR